MPDMVDEAIVVKIQGFNILLDHIGSPFFRIIRLTGPMALILRRIFGSVVFGNFDEGRIRNPLVSIRTH